MMRITKAPEERRQEILNTAMRLFYEQGYEKTSISDISKAMHVAQGLCYRYFPSKEALYDEAMDQYAEALAQRMTAGVEENGSSLKAMILQSMTGFEVENDGSYAYKFCHGPEKEKIHAQLSLAVCAKMVPVIKRQLDLAVKRGELVIDDTETAASFAVFGQLGILLDPALTNEEKETRIRAFLLKLMKLS